MRPTKVHVPHRRFFSSAKRARKEIKSIMGSDLLLGCQEECDERIFTTDTLEASYRHRVEVAQRKAARMTVLPSDSEKHG